MQNISRFITFVVIFVFSALLVRAEVDRLISYDELMTGTLDSEVYEHVYTFEGQAGDTILIQMRATSDDPRLDSFLYLRDADGNELFVDDDSGGNLNSLIGPYMLEESGLYTVVATRFMQAQGTSEGTYDLLISKANFTPIQVHETVKTEIGSPDELALYSLAVAESGLYEVRFDLLSGEGNAELSIRNSQGAYINGMSVDGNRGSSFVVMKLDAEEAVTLMLKRFPAYDNNGQTIDMTEPSEIEFSVEQVVASDLIFSDNASARIQDQLETREDVNYYHFNMETGQTLSITGDTVGDGHIEVYVVGRDGYYAFYGSTQYTDTPTIVSPQIATGSGDYVLVVHRNIIESGIADDSPVAYDIVLNVGETPRLNAGFAVEGSIDTASGIHESAYLYAGRANEVISLSLSNLDDNYQPAFSIEIAQSDITDEMSQSGFYANFNSSMAGHVSYDFTLPVDGTYIVRIYDGGYQEDGQPGMFRLLLESN